MLHAQHSPRRSTWPAGAVSERIPFDVGDIGLATALWLLALQLPTLSAVVLTAALVLRVWKVLTWARAEQHWPARTPISIGVAELDSPAQAIKLAETMLAHVAVGDHARCSDQTARLWLTLAVYPLAALLYAASPYGNGKGMAWVVATASAMAEPLSGPTWQQAATQAGAADAQMYDWLIRMADGDPGQRASIGVAMREALAAHTGSAR